MKCQRELSIIGAYGGYSKTPAKHAPVVGNSVLNLLINILGSGSLIPSAVLSLTESEKARLMFPARTMETWRALG